MKTFFRPSCCWLCWASPQKFLRLGTSGNKLCIFEILSSASFVEWVWCLVVKTLNTKEIVTRSLICSNWYNFEWSFRIMNSTRYLLYILLFFISGNSFLVDVFGLFYPYYYFNFRWVTPGRMPYKQSTRCWNIYVSEIGWYSTLNSTRKRTNKQTLPGVSRIRWLFPTLTNLRQLTIRTQSAVPIFSIPLDVNVLLRCISGHKVWVKILTCWVRTLSGKLWNGKQSSCDLCRLCCWFPFPCGSLSNDSVLC